MQSSTFPGFEEKKSKEEKYFSTDWQFLLLFLIMIKHYNLVLYT